MPALCALPEARFTPAIARSYCVKIRNKDARRASALLVGAEIAEAAEVAEVAEVGIILLFLPPPTG